MDASKDDPLEGEFRVKSTDEAGTNWRNSADWAQHGPPGGWDKKAVNWSRLAEVALTIALCYGLGAILKTFIH